MDEFYCEYAMPCGWCDKLEKQCPKLISQTERQPDEQSQEDYCDHEFETVSELAYYPSIRRKLRCLKCGFEKTQYVNM